MHRVLITSLICSCATTQSPADARIPKPSHVFVVGAMHNMHLQAKYGYSFADLAAQATKLQPDLICAEITEQDLDTNLEGIYPPEVAVLQHVAKQIGADLVGADWRDYPDAQEEDPPDRIKKEIQQTYAAMLSDFESFDGESLFDHLHCDAFKAQTRKVHDLMVSVGAAYSGFWQKRNQTIVKNCLGARGPNHDRVLFVFGSEHSYAIEDELTKIGISPSPVSRLFSPAKTPVPKDVLQRWQDNQDALKTIMDESTAPGDIKDKVEASGRIEALAQVLASDGAPVGKQESSSNISKLTLYGGSFEASAQKAACRCGEGGVLDIVRLVGLQSLERLVIADCQVQNMQALRALTSLRELHLYVSLGSVGALTAADQITSLLIPGHRYPDVESLRRLKNLKELVLWHQTDDGELAQWFGSHLPGVRISGRQPKAGRAREPGRTSFWGRWHLFLNRAGGFGPSG